MSKASSKQPKITEAELQSAMRKFMAAGGMIRKLPDQVSPTGQMVGTRWNNSAMESEPNQN